MKKYKAVIYDLDGTLVNTLDMNMYPLLRIIKEENGEDWELKDVLKFYAYPGMKTIETLGFKNPEETYKRWVKYVNEYEGGATIYDGFEEVLEIFDKAGIIQAVVSSKKRAQYEIDIVSKGIDKYIKTAVLEEDTIRHKPDPEPMNECLKRLGLSADEVIYIGDTHADCKASEASGMDFGYARWGSVTDDGIENPEYVFEKPLDLLSIIE